MACHRSTWAEINLDAFRHNLRAIRNLAGPEVKIMVIIKADAYGHGAVPCARAALEAGADFLGVAVLEEGIELRESGLTAPTLVLCGIFPNEVEDLIRFELSTIVSTSSLVHTLTQKANQAGKKVGVHLKIDTGMGRLGVLPKDFLCLVEHVVNSKNLRLEGLSTHFSSAEEEDSKFTLLQLSRFQEAQSQLKAQGITIPLIHAANSAALIKYPQSRFNMIRPGIILYGALPSPAFKPTIEKLVGKEFNNAFRPVMSWKSKIIQVNSIPKGSPLSYNQRYATQKDSLIATLPLGYADGLHRNLSNKMQVLVRGKRVRQVGTICMDMILIDATDVPGVQTGDEVVIIGRQGKESVTVEEMADWSGTITYEVLCAVGKRVPRLYPD